MFAVLYVSGCIAAIGFLFGVLGGIAEYAMSKSKKLDRWFDNLPMNKR